MKVGWMSKAYLTALIGLAAISTITTNSIAQQYPARNITVIVPFSAGGTTDVLARIVADHMGKTLGQKLIVENVTGAGGTIATTKAFKAAPDGYTILAGNLGTNAAAYSIYKGTIEYDPREFDTVGMIAGTPMYLAVKKDFPAKSLQEFIDYAKKNPGKVTAGHGGVGATSHLVCLYIANIAKIDMISVPYKGSGPAMTDLMGGQIDSVCDQAPQVVPVLPSGNIRALVVAEQERLPVTPDVPTSKEAGIPTFQVRGWNALFAPKGTPPAVIEKLNAALVAALADPTIQKRIDDLGAVRPKGEEATPAWLKQFVRSEVDKWGKVVADSGVKFN